MRVIFWQNCLSPHQLPYIVHLIDDERIDSVVVVAGEVTHESRKEMGWNVTFYPGLERCEVYISPRLETIDHLLKHRMEDSYHLFSGIRGFQFVFKAFTVSLKYRLRRGLISERPYTFAFGKANGKPLCLHKIRFFLQDRKFAPYIKSVFAMGNEAKNYFASVYKRWLVFPFGYCTQFFPYKENTPIFEDENTRFVYVGSLSRRKAVITILRANNNIVNKCKIGGGRILLIGNGAEESELKKYTDLKKLENIEFADTKNNSEIPSILDKQDILILPSIYDGWGAVVNEALSRGVFVICSDKCGAKELLYDKQIGVVFKAGDSDDLTDKMRYCIEHINDIREHRFYRRKWAENSITGSVIAKYMVDCLIHGQGTKPWK